MLCAVLDTPLPLYMQQAILYAVNLHIVFHIANFVTADFEFLLETFFKNFIAHSSEIC